MEFLFGSSWKTSMMGLVGGVILYFSQVGVAFPTTAAEWKIAIGSAFLYAWGRMQKDSNVTNAPKPDVAKPVL